MELKQHLCMSMSSFDKVLSYIRTSLEVDLDMAQLRGGVIILEISLYCMLCYLAGGSYTEIYIKKHCSTTLYGRRCMPLSDVKTYELPGQI